MKYCKRCGKEIEDDVVYCPACGSHQYNDPVSTNVKANEDSGIGGVVCLVLSLIIPLIGLIAGIVYFASSKPKNGALSIVGFVIGLCIWMPMYLY